jgi:PAS domain S-box-containing protein
VIAGNSSSALPSLIDAIASPVVAVDVRGRVTVWNRAAEDLFGWRMKEVLGRVPPFVPDALRQEWRLQMRQVLEGGRGTVAAETQRISRDGRTVSVLRTSAPLVDADGQVIGIVDTLTDITAHKQLDDESRALTQVRERELIAMDLHDGLIQSLYALALSLAADERAPELDVETARAALGRSRVEIERLVEEMRSYLFDLRSREFAPRELASGLRLLLDALRLNAGIEPRLTLDPAVDAVLDPEVRGHLLYVAREAISNILRHAGATAVSLSIVLSGDAVELTVADNGRGFDPSTRSPSGRRGLRNMASRARFVGGRLEVDSQVSGGTRIRLTLRPAASPGPRRAQHSQ